MTKCEIVAPLSLQYSNEATCNSPWFVKDTEYKPRPASYKPLINGEEAFRAVHEAIAKAKKSVDIICWGFQPSMYFIRDRSAPSIGELLMNKAKKDKVRVRILGWEAPFNLAGYFAGESNLPGKGYVRIGDRAGQTATNEQYAYDRKWFDECSAGDNQAADWTKACPVFVSRGFDPLQRTEIAYQAALHSLDPALSKLTIAFLAGAATHHQKTVLVDYEIPELAVGFVMGHNMLDEYWDTDQHSAWGRTPTDRPAANAGARGRLPRQDISSRVTGPILAHLHHNFATGWRVETGENLFVSRNAEAVAQQLPLGKEGTPLMAQLLRTQAQERQRNIESLYLQAVNNATQFIYIENQYFRWPALADAILKTAKKQTNKGRDPGLHGALHLFVVTNANEEGVGPGIVNTQRMLELLGREDGMPEVTKLRRIDQAKERAAEQEPAWSERLERKATEWVTALPDALNGTDLGERARDAQRQADEQARQRKAELEREVEAIKKSEIKRPPERPGLKVHVCSLVAKDSPADAWMPVYIHSKLMIIDDVFTTHGSANINTRSMQVDSEMNIAHEEMAVTQPMRRRLWDLHTNGKGAQDDPKSAFDVWQKVINDNKGLQSKRQPPLAPIIEFYFDPTELKNQD
ncbi:PLD-like domain-containing protein [Pseudomonas delhiensis]|uniref:PLD-like domain-containing protein n=1 Tax=Pseudomonas delhiensis TaxID=366289 RepID=A0A239NPF2_9PSED|nr:phospholipase D-like domain-containing protein [Pseudomonas delhiensis]SDL19741.1 PLD-like domain-containing protein [Pseudomonas delhiensis]SNT56542.1 PLD-like domain-containing protein [Pseudomonas delhiensis]